MTIITVLFVPWTAWIFLTVPLSEEAALSMSVRPSVLLRYYKYYNHPAPISGSTLPQFVNKITNVTVNVGCDALLACVVDNVQHYKVAWMRVDTQAILSIHQKVITQNPRIKLSYNQSNHQWSLYIKQVQEVDRGWYMCLVNTKPLMSLKAFVQVLVPLSIITSTDMVVREASNVTLTCKATGYPEPYVIWRREDGKNINYNGESVNVVNGEVLHIVKINRLHMGVYLCIASNGVPSSVSKRVSLRVQFPPTLSIPNQLEGAYIGQDVTLECHIEAYPKLFNYWTTEDDNIIAFGNVSNDKYEAVVTTDSGYNQYMMLKIRNVDQKDFDSYKCVAKNDLGGTDGVIELNEIPAPSTTSTTQPLYYATSAHKNDRDYGPASMRPPGEVPDVQSPGVYHRARLVLHLSSSLLSLLLPAIRK